MKKKISHKISLYPLKVIIFLYFFSLTVFLIFRILFLIYNYPFASQTLVLKKIFDGFVNGFRYDIVPLTYGFAIVMIFLLLYDLTKKMIFRRAAFWTAVLWLIFLITLYLADIVYYNKFATHLNAQVFFWLKDFPTVVKMILTAPELGFILLPALLLWGCIYLVVKRIFQCFHKEKEFNKSIFFKYVLAVTLMFFLGKGKIIGHALSEEMAFTDDNFFMNDFKINPFFILKKSLKTIHKPFHLSLMDPEQALLHVRSDLKIDTLKYTSPIARDYVFESEKKSSLPNIVFIFLERKASWKMAYFGNKDSLTPFLDSLFLQSLSFDRFYSGGTRTFEGIFCGLFGYPVLFGEHPLYGQNTENRQRLSSTNISTFYGLPQVLKDTGYTTIYFCPHTPRFDNMGVFLPHNGFDYFYSEQSFPDSMYVNSWGVDDLHLFRFVLQKLDRFYKRKKPFFAVIQTITDHEPYYFPDSIPGKIPAKRAARYADMSLKYFFDNVQKKPWYNNTVFILVGDHGKPLNPRYPIDLGTHHVPLLFYGKNIQPQIIHTVGDQKDIMPTLLGLLKINYTDNTFGKNLLNVKDGYAYFNHYNLNGWLTSKYFVIIDSHGKIKGLFDLRDKKVINLKDTLPEIAEKLAIHLKAHLQSSFEIRKKHLQSKPRPLQKKD